MGYVIGVGLVGVMLWGTWRFYTSGEYRSKRPTPGLDGFRAAPERDGDSGPAPGAERGR
jgi:hypothetical protein